MKNDSSHEITAVARMAEAPAARNRCAAELLFLGLLTVALLAPFFNKAISSDAVTYLKAARAVVESPARPYDFSIHAAGRVNRGWDISNNPPAASYVMAGVIKLWGEREVPLHAVFSLFAVIAVLSMYLLARELGVSPFLSALLLLASPAFFVNATDVMLDIPLLACTLAGAYGIVRGGNRDSLLTAALGWTFIGIGALTKFTALLFVPVMLVWLLLNRKAAPHYLPALIPLAFLAGWTVHNLHFYGETQLFSKSRAVGFSFPLVKEIPLMTYIGGSVLFPLGILVAAAKTGKWYGAASLVLFIVPDLFFNALGYSALVSFLLALFVTCAIIFFAMVIRTAVERPADRTALFLAAWLALTALFFAGTSAIIAVRYLVPLVPAAVLLFVKMNAGRKPLLSLTAGAGMLLSLALAHADYRWAGAYRDAAAFFRAMYGANLFFTGYLGFQYYMEKQGFVPVMSARDDYPPGATIIASVIPDPQKIHPSVRERLALRRDFFVTAKTPLRTISPESQAGFHLNLYGLLPYSFSRRPLEKFSVYTLE